jgi:hypothetical protein
MIQLSPKAIRFIIEALEHYQTHHPGCDAIEVDVSTDTDESASACHAQHGRSFLEFYQALRD